MEIIYKGTLYTVPIVSPTALDAARLYNLATQSCIITKLVDKSTAGSSTHDYEITLEPTDTASIPQGIYNLELYSVDTDGNPIIQAYYENYAKVKESSFTQDYA